MKMPFEVFICRVAAATKVATALSRIKRETYKKVSELECVQWFKRMDTCLVWVSINCKSVLQNSHSYGYVIGNRVLKKCTQVVCGFNRKTSNAEKPWENVAHAALRHRAEQPFL